MHTEILLPDHAPTEYADRAKLWNAVEKIEINKNAQLSREIELALPVELTRKQNISLVREYVNQHFVSAGMCADIAIHDKKDGNPHAHIMLTMRPIERDGTWGAKSRKEYILDRHGEKITLKSGEFKNRKISVNDWNDQTKAEVWREAWAEAANAALERENHEARIDHRSYERQGIDQIPAIHLGPAAHQMEKRGIHTERGDINREIEISNQRLRQLKARMVKAKKEIAEIVKEPTAPTVDEAFQNVLNRPTQSHFGKIRNLKTAAELLIFMQENGIHDMEGVERKLKKMMNHQSEVRSKLNPIDRRLKTLDEHIKQAETYLKHKDIYKMYKQEKPKKQEAFRQQFHAEITLYEGAAHYLKGVMNGRTTLPIKAWKKEREALIAEKKELGKSYVSMKDELAMIDRIRKSARELMPPQEPRRTRDRGMER